MLWGWLALATAPAQAAMPDPFADPSVRLLAADRTSVRFEVIVPEPLVHRGDPREGGLDRVVVEGYAPAGDFGSPGLPERIVWVGIPEGARVVIDAAPFDEQEWTDVRLAPLAMRRREPATDETQPISDPPEVDAGEWAALAASEPYRAAASRPAAALERVTGMRAQTVAAVRVRAARYDAQAQRLVVPRRIEVTVRLEGGRAGAYARDEAFESVYRALLVNYESARAFRSPLGDRARRTADTRPLGARSVAASAAYGFDIAPRWVRVAVDLKGLQRITGEDLQAAGVTLSQVNPAQLRLFTRPGVPLLEEEAVCDTCGLVEVAIEVTGAGDGQLNTTDAVLFFGLAPSGWRDDFTGPEGPSREWLDHPYETRNVYWLTWEASVAETPRRITTRTVAPVTADAIVPADYPGRLHFEQNQLYRPNNLEHNIFWDQWAWFEADDGLGPQQFLGDAPGAIATQPARLVARFFGESRETALTRDFSLFDHYQRVTFNGVPFQERSWYGFSSNTYDTTATWIRETGNQLIMQVVRQIDPGNPLRKDKQALFFWELYFRRRLVPTLDQIEFESPETTGAVAYTVSPWSLSGSASTRLFDVSDPIAPVELTGFVLRDTTSGRALYFEDVVDGRTFYYGAAATRFRRPRAELVEVRNLRATAPGADYLIIAYDEFEPQAQRLADLRRNVLPGVSAPVSAVTRVSDIFAWYSGGRLDPTAIRNYLYDLTTGGFWANVPAYVVFFGDASYDFKNILRLAPPGRTDALVPAYVHGHYLLQYMTDDWLADMDIGEFDPVIPGMLSPQSQVPDFFIGRLPASTAGEASTLVDAKIIPYDVQPNFGEWRQRILLAADDTTQGRSVDPLRGLHILQSELLETATLPPDLEREKLYLVEYPFPTTGSEKPLANQEAKRQINDGVVLWNFIGHGNPFKMADENLFIISDVPALRNLDKLTFLVAASCDVGKFDDAVLVGLGEALVKAPEGGAIGSFSATDIAFASDNASLNAGLFRALFAKTAQGYTTSLGEACYIVKRRSEASENDRKYALQGDPGTRLGTPRYDVRLALFDDETGQSLADSLPRGRRVRLEAEVHGTHDTTLTDLRTDFDGTGSVWVTGSAPLVGFTSFSRAQTFVGNPGSVFRGEVPIVDGRGTVRFYVPLEAEAGPRARARVYVQSEAVDGNGSITPRVVASTSVPVDTVPPTITLRFADGRTTVPPGAELRIVIEDEHGINISGRTQPNAITLRIDDGTRIDLTERFRYDAGSYTRGTIVFTLPALAPGNHEVEVTAADNFALGILGGSNRGRASLAFTVSPAAAAASVTAFNFPNPFRPGTGTNVIVGGVGEASRVEVRFYTVGGTLIRTLTASGGSGQIQVGWDGRDESGAAVANGVYLYQVVIQPLAGGGSVLLEGRAAAVR